MGYNESNKINLILDQEIDEQIKKLETDRLSLQQKALKHPLPARYFMIYLFLNPVAGWEELLRGEVTSLLNNRQSFFLHSTDNSMSSGELLQTIDRAVMDAGRLPADVENLNQIVVVPIINCVGCTNYNENIWNHIIEAVQLYMNGTEKHIIWNPFLILDDRMNTSAASRHALQSVCDWLCVKQQVNETKNRCCVLSAFDDGGFPVDETSLMHTIGLISVLQNVRTNRLPQEAENAISSLPHRWLLDYNQTPEQVNASLFFTARAFPVLCPVRSLLLQRINSAIDFFDGQTDSQAIKPPQYAGGGFTYLQKAQRREASLLPLAPGSTPDNPEITFAPLYGTMRNPDASEQDYWNEIVNVCQTRYFDCIKAYSPKNVALARIDFLREYFQNNGSLYVLPDLKEGDDQSKPCGFQYEPVPDRKACKKVGYPIDVALSVVNSFKQNLDKRSTDLRSLIWQDLRGEQLRQRIQNVIQAIEELKLLLSSHVRELSSKKEIQVLMEASAQHDTFEGQAADWVQRKFQGGNQQREIQEIKRYKSLYNNTICSILIGEVALEEGMERILDHCAKAVLSTQDDTDSKIFFDRLAVVCSNPDELTLRVKRIEDSLHYALKFHHGNVSGQDYRFTIGSTGNNQLFSNLTDGLKASGIPVDEFDRLEVIRFSSPFGADGLQIMNIRNVEA